jgi:hypothetical protein
LAFFSYVGLIDRSPGVTDTMRLWAAVGISTAVCLLLNSLMFWVFEAVRSRWSWYGALIMSLIGFGVSLGLCWVGYQGVVEERRRGGDWEGLHIATAWLFGVIGPLALETFPLALFAACLLILRPRTTEKGKVSDVDRDLS